MTAPVLDPNKALIVFSGGQDSTTCLYWAIEKFLGTEANNRECRSKQIKVVTFNYGQKHDIELKSAAKIAELAGIEYDQVNVPEILRGTSPLTDKSAELEQNESINDFKSGLASTFVPGRNALFLTIAANLAYVHGAANIITGVCQTDFAGYYDCRQDFISSQEATINQALLGSPEGFKIHTPLMNLTKKESVELLVNLKQTKKEALEAISYSHTCYSGTFPPCDTCHACHLRARGFGEAGIEDPLIKRAKQIA